MKIKNYENKILIKILIVILLILELIFISFITTNKIYSYKKIDGIVIKDDLIMLVVSKKEQKIINKNKYLYFNNKKIKYKIEEEKINIITNDNKKYNQILLKFKFNKKYKTNDIISVTFKNNKIKLIEIFKIIIEGG